MINRWALAVLLHRAVPKNLQIVSLLDKASCFHPVCSAAKLTGCRLQLLKWTKMGKQQHQRTVNLFHVHPQCDLLFLFILLPGLKRCLLHGFACRCFLHGCDYPATMTPLMGRHLEKSYLHGRRTQFNSYSLPQRDTDAIKNSPYHKAL